MSQASKRRAQTFSEQPYISQVESGSEVSIRGNTDLHEALFWDWWQYHLPSVRATEATLRCYKCAGRNWLDYLQTNPGNDPSPLLFAQWINHLLTEGKSVRTVATYAQAVRSLYRWAEASMRHANFTRAAKVPSGATDTPLPCPSTEQVKEMLQSLPDSPKGRRDKALVEVMYSTGLRCISLFRARLGDFDVSTGTLMHQPKGHAGKDAVAVLSRTAREALGVYLMERGALDPKAPLFDSVSPHRGPNGLNTQSMRRIILSLSEGLGLVHRVAGKVRGRGHYSAHSIRRAAVTRVADVAGLEVAQNFAGHASADTTRRSYARVKKYDQLKKLSDLMSL